jgi:HlyD family secretion protein
MAIRDTAGQDTVMLPVATRRRRWRWLALILVPVLIATAAWPALSRYGQAERSISRERLRFATVTRGHFVADVSAQGKAVAAVSPTLYASAPGVVTLQVAAGEAVQKGQVLAVIDSPDVANELARETANLDGLRSAVARQKVDARTRLSQGQLAIELAKVTEEASARELLRAEDALKRGVMPDIEVARRADELTVARVRARQMQEEAGLLAEGLNFELKTRQQEAARQQLLVDNLRRRADELTVRAPVAGVVGTLSVAQKAAVAANQPLLTVVDLSALEVEIQVPETYAQSMGLGMAADISWGSAPHRGQLTALSPEVTNGQVIARVRFNGETPKDLRQNQRVAVRIVLDERDGVLTVARGPFLEAGGGLSAYVVSNGIARRQPIRTGVTSLAAVEILDGLQEGDQIVLSGNDGFENAETLYLRN